MIHFPDCIIRFLTTVGEVVTTTTGPPLPVTPEPNTAANAVNITWHLRANQDAFPTIEIEQDQFLRFSWDEAGIFHTLSRVTEEAFTTCSPVRSHVFKRLRFAAS